MFSIKMRSSKGGINGSNGKHISGAERIVGSDEVESTVLSMLRRARSHERGQADFINIKISEFCENTAVRIPLLNVYEKHSGSAAEGRKIAAEELIRIGVSDKAVKSGLSALEQLSDSMRGAMIIDAVSGVRLDHFADRGVRCSNMDIADADAYIQRMSSLGLSGIHAREALVLASKVASADGTAAELCWSDDPNYVTGYVASPQFGYCRINIMKEIGDPVGGRIFFIKPNTDLSAYIDYLQNKIVLVEV